LSAVLLLNRDILILVAVQGSGSIGLLAKRLNCCHHGALIRLKCCTQCCVVVDVAGHRVEDRWECHERDESRIEALLLSGVCERGTL
jgi:hypothetical protein